MKTLRALFLFNVAAALVCCGAGSAAGQNLGATLAPADSTPAKPSDQGFIQRWLILEPIHVSGVTDRAVQRAVKATYFPDQFTVIPHDGDQVKAGEATLTWHAVDTKNYNVNLFHFGQALHKPTTDVLFWAVTIVDSPEEMRGVRLAIGSNAASVWWLNGQEVVGIYGDRQTVVDDGVSKRVTLKKGQNVIRCAVVNAGGATDFCARFLDQNDQPIRQLTVTLKDQH